MRIYKYVIRDTNSRAMETQVNVPEGSKMLDVQWQEGVGIVMWAFVDESKAPVTLDFSIFNTGERLSEKALEELIFINSVQEVSRKLVSHVFLHASDNLN